MIARSANRAHGGLAALSFAQLRGADRRTSHDAASKVSQYRMPGEQNPQWKAILQKNALYTKIELPDEGPGAGTAQALGATLDAFLKHREARKERRERDRAAQTVSNLQLRRAFEWPTQDGSQGVFVEVYNPGPRTITAFQFAVDYLQGQQVLYTDNQCRGATSIPPGQVGQVGCYKQPVPGAFSWQIRLVDIGVD